RYTLINNRTGYFYCPQITLIIADFFSADLPTSEDYYIIVCADLRNLLDLIFSADTPMPKLFPVQIYLLAFFLLAGIW
ncbi:MAG: hypothetical protein WA839_07715, partial [Flavobacteriaceae bacterium]